VTPGPNAHPLQETVARGGVAVFPADTVYGLACDPDNAEAVRRLYALKGRVPDKPSAVMFFALEAALAALPELGARTRDALRRLMPGGVSVLVPNPGHRYPLACPGDPDTLGIRVPVVPALGEPPLAVLQSSANLAGRPDARRLADVPAEIRAGADLVLDGGELPGTPSTVIDLRGYDETGDWSIVRPGAISETVVTAALEGQFHFDPDGYGAMIRAGIPVYDAFQDAVVAACREGDPAVQRILELGTGTGETSARLLARHPRARLTGIDESAGMLDAARRRLPDDRVELHAARLQDPLPAGPFELVASALAVHHLTGAEKQSLFARVHAALSPGGRFVLGEVIVPLRPDDQVIELTPGYDRPDTLSDLLVWLAQAGFSVTVAYEHRDLAVLVGTRG
jgi:tRNA threonylcarbamoyl adenosine modification protein (Sua5/YciO/YrdC/YwlC family)